MHGSHKQASIIEFYKYRDRNLYIYNIDYIVQCIQFQPIFKYSTPESMPNKKSQYGQDTNYGSITTSRVFRERMPQS